MSKSGRRGKEGSIFRRGNGFRVKDGRDRWVVGNGEIFFYGCIVF